MKRVSQNYTFVALALLVEIALPGVLRCQQEEAQLRQYDVVPPVWITADGDMDYKGEGAGETRAFVFPSLAPADTAVRGERIELENFLRPHNRLKSARFEWRADKSLGMAVNRSGSDIVIEIDDGSMSLIRKLDWDRFRQLQGAFRDWLLERSGCLLFSEGESRFSELGRHLRMAGFANVVSPCSRSVA